MSDINQSQTGILYHVTIGSNLDSILSDGVDPNYSKGKFDASWYVSKENILWAILHVVDRHDCKLDDVYVCAVVIDWRTMRRTNRTGRYYTKHCYQIENSTPARWHVEES